MNLSGTRLNLVNCTAFLEGDWRVLQTIIELHFYEFIRLHDSRLIWFRPKVRPCICGSSEDVRSEASDLRLCRYSPGEESPAGRSSSLGGEVQLQKHTDTRKILFATLYVKWHFSCYYIEFMLWYKLV